MIAYNKIWIRNVENEPIAMKLLPGIINDAAALKQLLKISGWIYTPNFLLRFGIAAALPCGGFVFFWDRTCVFRDAHTSTLGVMGSTLQALPVLLF